jgi:2-amino-4-hydroxy-6-hydroxymethyldihydropteridine diphosphokinase
MGRTRGEGTTAKGPRIIDIDILFVDGLILDTPELTLPHPAMAQRRFVLAPLVEIAPEVGHPILKQNAREMLEALHEKGGNVRRFSDERTLGNH